MNADIDQVVGISSTRSQQKLSKNAKTVVWPSRVTKCDPTTRRRRRTQQRTWSGRQRREWRSMRHCTELASSSARPRENAMVTYALAYAKPCFSSWVSSAQNHSVSACNVDPPFAEGTKDPQCSDPAASRV